MGSGYSIVAAVLGACLGVVGFLPILLTSRYASRRHSDNIVTLGLLGLGASFLFMLLVLFVCHLFWPDKLLVFGIFAAAAFLVGVGVYAVVSMKRMNSK